MQECQTGELANERLLHTVMIKEKGNYLMPSFSSIKVSAYANYLAEASTGRGKNNYYISEGRFILCCWRPLEEEVGR